LANNTGLKRKRRPGVGAATKAYRPPLKTPQLQFSSLVDYDEDEDEESTSTVLPQNDASSSSSVIPTADPSTACPPSVSASSRPLPKRTLTDDDDDNLLEALARNNRSRPQSPAPTSTIAKLGEKRRREEEEEEEQLFRPPIKPLKKPDLGSQKETSSIRRKIGDDPPAAKKFKVKLGAIGLSVASSLNPDPTTINFARSPSSTSQPGAKDGDTG
jgi:protein phosphatase-4 regulatory subunit 3